LVITSKDIMQRPSSAIALLLSQMYRIAIYTQEPSRNVLIVTSKPPLRRRLRNFAHLAAAAAGARGLWAPAGGGARPLGPPGARAFQRFFKALEAPKPLEPTGLPPCLIEPSDARCGSVVLGCHLAHAVLTRPAAAALFIYVCIKERRS